MNLSTEEKAKADNLQIRSDEVQEILGQMPSWLVRWGTILIILVVAILFTGAYFLQYPDIIPAKIQLTSTYPPAELIAKSTGNIEEIFVQDRQIVHKGETLAVIESSASFEDVLWIQEILKNPFSLENYLLEKAFERNLNLGNSQYTWAQFIKSIDEYKNFIDLDYYQRKIISIRKEINDYKKFKVRLLEQKIILNQEYTIALNQYKRDSVLFESGVLSKSDLEKQESQKLVKLIGFQNIELKLAEAQITDSELNQEILELELQLKQSNKNLYQKIKELHEKLKADITEWENQYLIIAPFEGQVSFSRIWSKNQNVVEGEIVLTVVPHEKGEIVGKLEVSSMGIGKIDSTNKVVIQFDNYPYMEFGIVTGYISGLSMVPTNELYYAEVKLDSLRLVSNFGRELSFQQNMTGQAKVITESRSLLDRVFAPLKTAINNHKLYSGI